MAGAEQLDDDPDGIDSFDSALRRRLKKLRWAQPSDETRRRSLEEFERRLDALEQDSGVKD